TIRRRLLEAGLQSCVAAQKPHLTEKQRKERLAFAQAVEQWSVEDWGEVVFSDESTCSTRWDLQRRVWRPLDCRRPDCSTPELVPRKAAPLPRPWL
ncbi:hypothetical protein V5799_023289, partial [Amblyomma americanum]